MNVALNIDPKRIADLMITACEHNDMTAAWCKSVLPKGGTLKKVKARPAGASVWYADPAIYDNDFLLEIVEFDETNGKEVKHVVHQGHMREAFATMAMVAGRHFGDFLAENEDSITADVFLQCLALGRVVYG